MSATPPVVVVQLNQHLLHFCFQQLRKHTPFGALYIHFDQGDVATQVPQSLPDGMQREELTELAVGSFAPGSAGFYVDSVAIGCTEPDGMEVDVLWLLWWPLANRWIERVHLTSAVAHCQVKGPVVSDAKAVHEARGLRPSCPEARAVCTEAYALATITSLTEVLETAVHRRHLQAQKRPHSRMLRQRGEGWIPRHAVSPAQQQCREQRNVDVHRCRMLQRAARQNMDTPVARALLYVYRILVCRPKPLYAPTYNTSTTWLGGSA